MKNTREKIICAAVSVWNEDYSAPLKYIAREAGISRMTLHRHFCGRDAILQAIGDDFVDRVVQVLDEAQQETVPPIAQMQSVLKKTHRLGEDYNFLFDLFEQKGCPEALIERFRVFEERFAAFFDTLMAQGVVKPGVNAKWANALLEGLMKSAFRMRQKGWNAALDMEALVWDSYQSAIFIQPTRIQPTEIQPTTGASHSAEV
ncbi:MAG: TetR/AcrR family transcriptional regulator [Hydrogenovibrio sp.]